VSYCQKHNFETLEGRSALALLYRMIMSGEAVPGLTNAKQILPDIGLVVIQDGVTPRDVLEGHAH
jgi:hypothetical protein